MKQTHIYLRDAGRERRQAASIRWLIAYWEALEAGRPVALLSRRWLMRRHGV